eukprot:3853943-Heterocapsa_arctica.AAC.1
MWAFCAWGMKPSDAPDAQTFYRKRTCAATLRVPGLRAALGRACPGVGPTHKHVQIEGRALGASISRAQEAGCYPDS